MFSEMYLNLKCYIWRSFKNSYRGLGCDVCTDYNSGSGERFISLGSLPEGHQAWHLYNINNKINNKNNHISWDWHLYNINNKVNNKNNDIRCTLASTSGRENKLNKCGNTKPTELKIEIKQEKFNNIFHP